MRISKTSLLVLSLLIGILTLHTLTKMQTAGIRVSCETTKGPLEITVMPQWSPLGAKRFLQLVDDGFFSNLPFFRCIEDFVCQVGAVPGGGRTYSPIADDPKLPELRAFKKGYLSFAGFAANSRSTHLFIALAAVDSLGTQPWETPFGYIAESSLPVISHLSTIYGESAPTGRGPDPQRIEATDGASYLQRDFPQLDSFLSCKRK